MDLDFFVWPCCSTESGCAIEGKGPQIKEEQRREHPDNNEGAITVKALVSVCSINVNVNLV